MVWCPELSFVFRLLLQTSVCVSWQALGLHSVEPRLEPLARLEFHVVGGVSDRTQYRAWSPMPSCPNQLSFFP